MFFVHNFYKTQFMYIYYHIQCIKKWRGFFSLDRLNNFFLFNISSAYCCFTSSLLASEDSSAEDKGAKNKSLPSIEMIVIRLKMS